MPTKTRTARYAVFGLEVIENIGLIIIGLATVVAGYHEVALMVANGKVTLADLLLMFLYLEVLTMVGLYYNSGKLPVRFPLYIAMVALARYLILDIKDLDVWRMLAVSGSVLLIALAVLVIRYGHVRFPYAEDAGRSVDTQAQPGNE
ncbi:MAG: phosphate-starvation-inducible PsiE family protein [Betaproteobacteria bacterium]